MQYLEHGKLEFKIPSPSIALTLRSNIQILLHFYQSCATNVLFEITVVLVCFPVKKGFIFPHSSWYSPFWQGSKDNRSLEQDEHMSFKVFFTGNDIQDFNLNFPIPNLMVFSIRGYQIIDHIS